MLATDDIQYRGVQIPRRSWKIAAWTTVDDSNAPTLQSAGFVLDQGPSLDAIDLNLRADADDACPPALGPCLTYQVPITDIATLTGLNLETLENADRLQPSTAARMSDRWTLLTHDSDITL